MKKKTLEDLYINKGLSMNKIGKITETSSGNVYYFLKKYNIPIRKAKRVVTNRDELKHLYLDKKMSLLDIAKLKKCSFQTIQEKLITFGIERRPYSTKGLSFPGRKLTKEHKEKLRKYRTGRKEKPEVGRKISKSLKKIYSSKYPEGYIGNTKNKYKTVKHNGKMEYIHRVVVEEKIGRKLKKNEVIHHINFNSDDNRIDNLLIFNSQSEHLLLHSQLEVIMKILMEKNIVYFKDGEYRVK